jgi:hypothetical protein
MRRGSESKLVVPGRCKQCTVLLLIGRLRPGLGGGGQVDIRVTGAETDEEEELLSLLRSLRFEACYPDLRAAGRLHSAPSQHSPTTECP